MDCFTLVLNAFIAGAGAFGGALAAYFLACRQDEQREIADYLSLLLIIYEQLESVYIILAEIPPESIKEVDGEKIVEFTMPFPEFTLTPAQLQTLMKVAPDKQMPSALIQFSHFLKMHSRRVAKNDVNTFPLEYLKQQAYQLKLMLMTVRVQYQKQTNAAFPLE